MVFHTPQKKVNYPTLKLNNVNIERVSQFNFLGVILASSLKWDKRCTVKWAQEKRAQEKRARKKGHRKKGHRKKGHRKKGHGKKGTGKMGTEKKGTKGKIVLFVNYFYYYLINI